MQSAARLRQRLLEIKHSRDSKKRTIKSQAQNCDDVLTSISNIGSSLTRTPFGGGMSSHALRAANPPKQEIRTTLISNAVDPARDAITGVKNAINGI